MNEGGAFQPRGEPDGFVKMGAREGQHNSRNIHGDGVVGF